MLLLGNVNSGQTVREEQCCHRCMAGFLSEDYVGAHGSIGMAMGPRGLGPLILTGMSRRICAKPIRNFSAGREGEEWVGRM